MSEASRTPTNTLLIECLEAFEAIPVAAKARKVLRKHGVTPGAYAGNGSHLLAYHMAEKLRAALARARATKGGER